MLKAIRRWVERQTTYESQEMERELIEAQRRDILSSIARLDQIDRKMKEKESGGQQENA